MPQTSSPHGVDRNPRSELLALLQRRCPRTPKKTSTSLHFPVLSFHMRILSPPRQPSNAHNPVLSIPIRRRTFFNLVAVVPSASHIRTLSHDLSSNKCRISSVQLPAHVRRIHLDPGRPCSHMSNCLVPPSWVVVLRTNWSRREATHSDLSPLRFPPPNQSSDNGGKQKTEVFA